MDAHISWTLYLAFWIARAGSARPFDCFLPYLAVIHPTPHPHGYLFVRFASNLSCVAYSKYHSLHRSPHTYIPRPTLTLFSFRSLLSPVRASMFVLSYLPPLSFVYQHSYSQSTQWKSHNLSIISCVSALKCYRAQGGVG